MGTENLMLQLQSLEMGTVRARFDSELQHLIPRLTGDLEGALQTLTGKTRRDK